MGEGFSVTTYTDHSKAGWVAHAGSVARYLTVTRERAKYREYSPVRIRSYIIRARSEVKGEGEVFVLWACNVFSALQPWQTGTNPIHPESLTARAQQEALFSLKPPVAAPDRCGSDISGVRRMTSYLDKLGSLNKNASGFLPAGLALSFNSLQLQIIRAQTYFEIPALWSTRTSLALSFE